MAIEDELVRLHEDERQIRNLIARLGHLADYGDLDDYMTLFTEDATWDLGGTVVHGSEAIHDDRVSRRTRRTQGPGSDTRHMSTTLWVEVDGSDVAIAHSYYVFVREAATAPTIVSTGRYHDTFRRTPDGWKLAERRIRQQD